jgi:signal transduction histidine kinase
MINTVLFTLYGYFYEHSITITRDSFIATVLFGLLAIWVYFGKEKNKKKELVSAVFFLSVISSFFVFNGFRGIGTFDFFNLFLFFFTVYEGTKRNYTVSILSLITLILLIVQLKYPEIIQDRAQNYPDWFFAVNFMTHAIMAVNIGMAFKLAYIKEHAYVKQLLKEMQTLNVVITSQNEELNEIHCELKASNENLENQVRIRTEKLGIQNEKLMMYAYMNSHIFRTPTTRIQGLLYLIKKEPISKDAEVMMQLIEKETETISHVTTEISKLISEQDEELVSEIKERVKVLYKMY